jgi:hypothetical protein
MKKINVIEELTQLGKRAAGAADRHSAFLCSLR